MISNWFILVMTLCLANQGISVALPASNENDRIDNSSCYKSLKHISQRAEFYNFSCSPQALQKESEEFTVSPSFVVKSELAPRVHFWKKIYQVFDSKDYVIHSKLNPWVIFEVIRLEQPNRKLIQKRKKYYSQILKRIAAGKNLRTDAEIRVEKLLSDHDVQIERGHDFIETRSQRGQKDFLAKGIPSAKKYLPHIAPYFEQKNIPVELSLIAFVESSFNLKAVSKVGASGVYQIMPFIARHHMFYTDHIDERRDPIKSGSVAAELFSNNYRLLKSWPLAVTAYNHGPYGIKRGLHRVNGRTLEDLIKNYNRRSFGFSSKNFFSGFLAIVSTLYPELEETLKNKPQTIRYREIQLKKPTRLSSLLKKEGIALEKLLELNPDLSPRISNMKHLRLPRKYTLKIPLEDQKLPVLEAEALSQ